MVIIGAFDFTKFVNLNFWFFHWSSTYWSLSSHLTCFYAESIPSNDCWYAGYFKFMFWLKFYLASSKQEFDFLSRYSVQWGFDLHDYSACNLRTWCSFCNMKLFSRLRDSFSSQLIFLYWKLFSLFLHYRFFLLELPLDKGTTYNLFIDVSVDQVINPLSGWGIRWHCWHKS